MVSSADRRQYRDGSVLEGSGSRSAYIPWKKAKMCIPSRMDSATKQREAVGSCVKIASVRPSHVSYYLPLCARILILGGVTVGSMHEMDPEGRRLLAHPCGSPGFPLSTARTTFKCDAHRVLQDRNTIRIREGPRMCVVVVVMCRKKNKRGSSKMACVYCACATKYGELVG